MDEQYVNIGHILRPQGVQGAVKIYPRFPEPEFYLSLEMVTLQKAEQQVVMVIDQCWMQGKFPIWHFQRCVSIQTAEQWVGYNILLPRSAFDTLPAGEYYWFEIEGLAVYSDTGEYLGYVDQVLNMGSSDLLLVKKGSQEFFLPVIREVIKTIDVPAQRVIIHCIPGLLSDNED